MIDLSVVIVNYNARHFLQICLDALQTALDGINAETIIIDNQSSDDSCSIIKKNYPWVTLIENKENIGFGKANNQAFNIAQGQNILILNPDTIVQRATLLESLRIIKSNPNVGAIGVKMLDGSGLFLPESKRGLPNPQAAFFKAFGLSSLFPKSKRFSHYYLGHLSEDKNCEVEILAGAYMMCPSHILKSCNGFDEDFFMYGEDIDLSYRITKLGYKNIYQAHPPIIHFKGESAGRDAIWAKRFYDAMHLFSEKHFSQKNLIYNKLINCGIQFKKVISKPKKLVANNNDLSLLDLLILTNNEICSTSSFLNSFKTVVTNKDIESATAILFMPDIDKSIAIATMNEFKNKKQYFFASKDKSFILSSPNSTSQGEVWDL